MDRLKETAATQKRKHNQDITRHSSCQYCDTRVIYVKLGLIEILRNYVLSSIVE